MGINNIILTSDNDTIEALKKAGFKFIKQESGISQFMFDIRIKFNFKELGKKIMFTNKMTF